MASQHLPRRNRSAAGLTLVELLTAMALTAILASLSYPSFRSVILRVHRADVLSTLAHIQLLQQRHRSNRPSFATLAELGLSQTTAGGRYRLQDRTPPTAQGFLILASAQGAQAADLPCSHLLLEINGAQARFASGPDAAVANGESDNQRCWGR